MKLNLTLRNGMLGRPDGGAILGSLSWYPNPSDPALSATQYEAFTKFLASDKGTPPAGVGDGIVTVCLGERYWPMTMLLARMLRETGCKVPLQIWHDGCAKELDDPLTSFVHIQEYGVQGNMSLWDAWAFKTFALLHCGFKRAFFIDADAYFVADPTAIFDVLDKTSFACWRNFTQAYSRVNWSAVGIQGLYVPALQGGHVLIHIEHAWDILVFADWLNQQRNYYYTYCGYGDEDTYRIAFAAYKAQPHIIAQVDWTGAVALCSWHGAPLIVHRCGSKLCPDTNPNWNKELPCEDRVKALFEEIVNGSAISSA
jgi:hypothetical protein